MKRQATTRIAITLILFCCAILASCGGDRYKEIPFAGMQGRVQKATVWHLMPEMWYAGNRGTDIMYTNVSIYDVEGHEICSAVMDSAGHIMSETESLFENGVCVRSTQKAGNRTIARLSLISKDRNTLQYNKENNGRIVRMTVKKSSFGRRHKSVVTEDGQITTISIIRTDRQGYPLKITITEPQTGNKTVETNKFDENHNVIEKHIFTHNGKNGKDEERITYTDYGETDDHGNWKDARTYDEFRLPSEVLVREFEYWE